MSSFRQIGELCRDVIAEAELRAARQGTAANGSGKPSGVAQLPDAPTTGGMSELGGGLPTGSVNNPPDAQADKGGTASELNGKGRGTVKATASVRGGAKQLRGGTATVVQTAYGQRMKPAVWLVASTGMPSVNRRPKASGHAAPALGRPVLVVVGGTHYTVSGSL